MLELMFVFDIIFYHCHRNKFCVFLLFVINGPKTMLFSVSFLLSLFATLFLLAATIISLLRCTNGSCSLLAQGGLLIPGLRVEIAGAFEILTPPHGHNS